MKNYEMINNAYTNLCEDLLNATIDLNKASSYNDYDANLKTIDTISVILKRLGETAILEMGEMPQHKEEIDVNKTEDIVEEIEGKEE